MTFVFKPPPQDQNPFASEEDSLDSAARVGEILQKRFKQPVNVRFFMIWHHEWDNFVKTVQLQQEPEIEVFEGEGDVESGVNRARNTGKREIRAEEEREKRGRRTGETVFQNDNNNTDMKYRKERLEKKKKKNWRDERRRTWEMVFKNNGGGIK